MKRERPDFTPRELRPMRALGTLLLLTVLLANVWLLRHLSTQIGIRLFQFLLLVVFVFDLCLLFGGFALLLARRKITIFRAVMVFISLIAWTVVLSASAEVYLAFRSPNGGPYVAFQVQHLHPFYLFSVSSDPKELGRINNSVVSVTPEGFRGPGSEQKGSRKLAFVIGGSAAFGWGASSNETTISGYLNEIQSDYHFVNAGVSSWNSTQEFYRVAMQLLQYKPDLIVVYDGFNDAAINQGHRHDERLFPPGTPESYDSLAEWVDDIRAEPDAPFITFNSERLYNLTLPRTRDRLSGFFDTSAAGPIPVDPAKPIGPEAVDRDAASYVWNVENMSRLAGTRGARLIVFWQAVSLLHLPDEAMKRSQEDRDDLEYLRRFHQYVLDHHDAGLQVFDLSDLFDRSSDKVPLANLFIDRVHLTDKGNYIVANEIWRRISTPITEKYTERRKGNNGNRHSI